MSNFEAIIQILSENKFSNLQFHADNVSLIKSSLKCNYSHQQNSKNQEKFCNYIQNNLKLFQNQVISAYINKQLLENLEENLNKLQIDTDFIFNFTSNWMHHLPNEAKAQVKLNELFLPGTHNSCSTQIIWSSKPVCFNKAQFCGSKLPLIRNTVKNIVLNQTKTIVEQVQAGIRLFDLRIATDCNNKLYIAHTFYVCELEQCLNEFKYCLNSYSNEIFVINFKIDYPYQPHFSQQHLNSVQKMFNSILGSFILPCREPLSTISCLVQTGKRLIVYCNLDNSLLVENNEFLNTNNLLRVCKSHEIWPDEDSLVNVVQKLTSCLENSNYPTTEFVYFSFNTTPKFSLKSLNCCINNQSENQIRIKENFYKKFLAEAFLNRISGAILDNPSFNLIQESIAFNFKRYKIS
jgi:hypothetical protein